MEKTKKQPRKKKGKNTEIDNSDVKKRQPNIPIDELFVFIDTVKKCKKKFRDVYDNIKKNTHILTEYSRMPIEEAVPKLKILYQNHVGTKKKTSKIWKEIDYKKNHSEIYQEEEDIKKLPPNLRSVEENKISEKKSTN